MIIERYGLQLQSLDQKHLQDLRQWRNRENTLSFMQDKTRIDAETQKIWFSQVAPSNSLMFTYHQDGIVHGFVQLKSIELEQGNAEAGVIHGNDSSRDSPISIIAILILMEIAFDLVGLATLHAKIRRDNHHVINLNRQLGYRLIPNQKEVEFPYFEVSKARFADSTKRFRTMLAKRHGAKFNLDITPRDEVWTNKIQPKTKFELIDPNQFFSNA